MATLRVPYRTTTVFYIVLPPTAVRCYYCSGCFNRAEKAIHALYPRALSAFCLHWAFLLASYGTPSRKSPKSRKHHHHGSTNNPPILPTRTVVPTTTNRHLLLLLRTSTTTSTTITTTTTKTNKQTTSPHLQYQQRRISPEIFQSIDHRIVMLLTTSSITKA